MALRARRFVFNRRTRIVRRCGWRWPVLVIAGMTAILTFGCGSDSDGDGGTAEGELTEVTYQLGWFVDEGLLDEVVAMEKGFYEEEGIDLEIVPGGPNNDGIAPVASGQADIGLASSSPAIMLAVSQGIPIQAFAAQMQEHPYAYVSMPETPLDSPQDLEGLTVGVPATGVELVEALLAANGMDEDQLGGIQNISFEVGPLLQGKVDVWGGWLTDTAQLALLPDGYNALQLYESGVPLYAALNFANPEFLEENPDTAAAFLRATARGAQFARENPEEAAQILVDAYPDIEGGSDVDDIVQSTEVASEYIFTESAEADGWGTMDPEVWERQLDLWAETGRFDGEPPAVDDVMTTEILEQTQDARDLD